MAQGAQGNQVPTEAANWGVDRQPPHLKGDMKEEKKDAAPATALRSDSEVLSQLNCIPIYFCLTVELHNIKVWSGSTRYCQDRSDERAGWELDLSSFGRKKHLSPLQLSFIPKYFAPHQSPWVLESISIKCSQSYNTEFKCALNSTSATEKCYSRNTLKRQV